MRKVNPTVTLSAEQEKIAAEKIKQYFEQSLDLGIGNIEARTFVAYLSEEIGKYYYNKGVLDSLAAMESKIEDLYSIMKEEEE